MAKKTTTTTRGVLIIALGHPEYGNMAYNLLMTIKQGDSTEVALVHNYTSISHLNASQQREFDHLIECPPEYYIHDDKPAYVKPKNFANLLTPFDETLFLDADTLLMPGRSIARLLAELSTLDADFHIKNTGAYTIAAAAHSGNPTYGYGGWETTNLPELARIHGLDAGTFWQLQGEVFWWRKSKTSSKIFKVAQDAWTKQRARIRGGFAGQNMNDELAFIIALAWLDIQLPASPWIPTYWWLLEKKRLDRKEVIGGWWLLSAGGNNVPAEIESFYNDIARAAAFNRRSRAFPLKRKSTYLPERKLF